MCMGDVDMKKNDALMFSIVAFGISFGAFWFSDVLIDRFFVFGFIPMAVAVLSLLVSFIVSIITVFRKPSVYKSYLAVAVSVFSVLVLLYFPFRDAKVHLELELYDKARSQVVEMVKSGDIISEDWGNAALPARFRHLSSDGNIFIYQNDEEQVISIWVFRGLLSGSVQLIYSSQDESLIYKNETPHEIESIDKLKEHWYLVETDY